MTITKNNFRGTLLALALGAIVTVVPASATTIGLSTSPTSGAPTYVDVGDYAWGVSGYNITGTLGSNGTLTLDGTSNTNSILNVNGQNTCNCNYAGSGVVDVTVTPTINGSTAQTAVTFQGTIIDNGGTFSLYFGNQGSTTCTTNCYNTGNGYTVTAAQSVSSSTGYTTLVSNGIDYEIATSTLLSPTKALNYVGGFVGIVVAPEPATYATTGLGVALLGFFLRRKKQNS